MHDPISGNALITIDRVEIKAVVFYCRRFKLKAIEALAFVSPISFKLIEENLRHVLEKKTCTGYAFLTCT